MRSLHVIPPLLALFVAASATAQDAIRSPIVKHEAAKVWIDNVPNYENIDSDLSHMHALRCILEYHGQPVDWDWLLGASGEAFCYYYHPDGTHLTQFVHSWDIANASLSLYGFSGQWRAASPGTDIAPAWTAMASEIAAGRPILAPGIMPSWNGINSLCDHWFVVTGLDPAAGKVTVLGVGDAAVDTLLPTGDAVRPYPQGPHPCWYGILRHLEPGKSAGHYGPDKPILVVARVGPPIDPKAAALAALERAVQLAHEPPVIAERGWGAGTYLAGLPALQRLHDDLLAAQGDGPEEYRKLNPKKDDPFDGLKPEIANLRLLAARRHAAAGFLRQVADLLPESSAPLRAAADEYDRATAHAQAAFDVCYVSQADWLKIMALEFGDRNPSTHTGWRSYFRKVEEKLASPANRQTMADHLAAVLTAEKAALARIQEVRSPVAE